MNETVTRRWMLGGTGAAGLALLAAACSGTSDGAATATTVTPTTIGLPPEAEQLGTGSFQLFAANDLNFQTLLALGAAGSSAAVGEVVTVVDQANAAEGGATYQNVYDAMVAMGNALEERAVAAANAGHDVTARNQFLRAAQYYNQALYWVLGTSTPGAEAEVYTAMNAAFVEAGKRTATWEQVAIPYESTSLAGWFMKPLGASGRLPVVIMTNGSDGQNIDMVAQGSEEAIARGYGVLIYEGPGQGNQLFLDNVVFRPDWEKVMTPVVDYLHTRSDVDTDKIAARGISFGGLLVPRAAAFEKRLAAVIADPGDVQAWRSYPSSITQIAEAGDQEAVNSAWAGIGPYLTAEQSFSLKKRLEIYTPEAHTQAAQGQVPSDWYTISKTIQTFDITDAAPEITAPTLVMDYEGDNLFLDGPQALYDLLRTEKKDMVTFTAAEGAQYHCAPMNPQLASETAYDWLDEVLGR